MKERRVEYKVFQLADRTDHRGYAPYCSSYRAFYYGYNCYVLEYVVENHLEQAEEYFENNICAKGRTGLLIADFGAKDKGKEYMKNAEWKEEERMIRWDNPRFYKKIQKGCGIVLLSHVCGMIVLKKAEEGKSVWMPSLMVSYIDRAGGLTKKRVQGTRRPAAQLMDYILKAPFDRVTVCTIDPYFRRRVHTQAIDFRRMDSVCPVSIVLETKWVDEDGGGDGLKRHVAIRSKSEV